MQGIILLLGFTAGTGLIFHIFFEKFNLRKRFAPKMQWWTPGALVLLFVCTAMLLVRLFTVVDPSGRLWVLSHSIEGVFLGFWIASVPVFSPNKRWDKP
ncbi:MAG: hypothetical protein ABF449_07055 [Ethanoligenens sp.]